jgi:hypothetical protein
MEGSLSCHTCCDTGPWFFRSHPKNRPIQSPVTKHKGMWRIYSNLDPYKSLFSRLFRHTRGHGGPILTRTLVGVFHIESGAIYLESEGNLESGFIQKQSWVINVVSRVIQWSNQSRVIQFLKVQ